MQVRLCSAEIQRAGLIGSVWKSWTAVRCKFAIGTLSFSVNLVDNHMGVSAGHESPGWFATTHWSVVLAAGEAESTRQVEALEQLCRAYWYPLYAYVRRKGHRPHEAQDLTQDFFSRLLARNYLSVADRNRGKFRSFLLGALEHFLAREWTKGHAQKRGGGKTIFSLDEMDAESRYVSEPADELTPEKIFDRRWATTVLEQAMTRLRENYKGDGRATLFEKLEGLLIDQNGDESYAQTAASLNMSQGAFKVAVHRIRQRYGELIRAEIAKTVAAQEAIDEELRYLFAVLRE
jgi:RNA polymerase sigma factor (sigma-70 family)